jgi:predicted DNA-binding transcriptional regulator AlpA
MGFQTKCIGFGRAMPQSRSLNGFSMFGWRHIGRRARCSKGLNPGIPLNRDRRNLAADRMTISEKLASGLSPRLLTAKEVAQQTCLSMETLAQWRSQMRGIPFVRISRNCVRYRQSDVDCWVSERIVRTSQGPVGDGRRD